jgi:hypothetical protein
MLNTPYTAEITRLFSVGVFLQLLPCGTGANGETKTTVQEVEYSHSGRNQDSAAIRRALAAHSPETRDASAVSSAHMDHKSTAKTDTQL